MFRSIVHTCLGTVLVLSLIACSSTDQDPGDGGNDDGSQQQGSRLVFEQIFSDTTTGVHSERLSWSLDDSLIAFSASPSDIYKVQSQVGSTPIKVTNATEQDWSQGGALPSFMENEAIAYYLGWIDPDDQDMHIMSASPEQVQNEPAPTIKQRYNGSDVGLGLNYASTPTGLSVSKTGLRAIAGYSGLLYTLDFSQPNPDIAAIGGPGEQTSIMLTADGTKITFVTQEQQVGYMNFDGTDKITLGKGASPTWSADGNKLGYLAEDQSHYKVFNLQEQTTTQYALPAGAYLEVALSSAGTKIAKRTFGGPNTGIAIAELKNGS